jgi:AcrR family transcriptional regulator
MTAFEVADRRTSNGRAARWHDRRNEIVDKAAQLFATTGYHGTGLTEICEAAGLGRGALYYYIESKENLLALIHDRVMEHVLDNGRTVRALELPAAERLRRLSRGLVKIIAVYPDLVWVFLHEYRVLSGERREHFRRSRRDYEQIVESILSQGVRDGEFDIADVRLAALGWLGLHNYIYLWFGRQSEYDAQQIAETFSSIFLGGVGHDRDGAVRD